MAKNFESANGDRCVKAVYQANQGLLYPLEKSMFFIWIPAFIKHNDIDTVEFRRMFNFGNRGNGTFDSASQHATTFDLAICLKRKFKHMHNHNNSSNKQPKAKPIIFANINKSEYQRMVKYFLSKPNVALMNKELHAAQVNANGKSIMSKSSRSTRTRKNIKPPSDADLGTIGSIGTVIDAGDIDDDDDDDEDEDYDMQVDANMLKQDEKYDREHEKTVNNDE